MGKMEPGNTKSKEPSLGLAATICFVLWIVYTILYTLPLKDIYRVFLEPLPGIIGVIILSVTGFRDDRWYLRIAPLSARGLAILGVMCLVLLAPLEPAILEGNSVAFHGFSIHFYALTSGIAQEIFFRAVLLPLCITGLGKKLSGTALQALLFGLWHLPRAYQTAPITPWVGASMVGIVTFLAGLGWGWQVQHDRTIIWTSVQHVVFLLVMSLFGL
jgi:hypothetical protein